MATIEYPQYPTATMSTIRNQMRLWIESAQQSVGDATGSVLSSVIDDTPVSGLSTLTTEEEFVGLVVNEPRGGAIEAQSRSLVS